MAHALSVSISNNIDELPQLIELVKTFLAPFKLAYRMEYAVQLVMEEIIVNTVTHGYHDQEEHEIVIEVKLEGNKILFTFCDDGRPFNPLSVPPPEQKNPDEIESINQGGLGMHFVRTIRQSMEYRRADGKNILKVWIMKES